MMASLEKPKVLIITYDNGERGQTLRVPHHKFEEHIELRENINLIKCLFCDSSDCIHCNYEEAK